LLRAGHARAADGEPAPTCPASDAVWATVLRLVPSAAAQLNVARPRVEIVDLGESYRVHVETEGGPLERTYQDPARDCEKRNRFAAEFIVVALLPPQLLVGPVAPEPAPDAPPEPPKVEAPPTPPAVPPPHDSGVRPTRHVRILRVEVSGVAAAGPPVLGAPGILEYGGDLRVRIGPGRVSALLGVGYMPRVEFHAGDFRGAITRAPAIAGVGIRLLQGSLRVDGSAAAAVSLERYEGVSPHAPAESTRMAPGLEVALVASPRPLLGLAPILGLGGAWMPVAQDLTALPEGKVAQTPSFWFGVTVGASLEL
jgi:hypothetical protein